MTILELARIYQSFAVDYYRKPSTRRLTREHQNINDAMRTPIAMFGSIDVNDFTPARMHDVQNSMIAQGLARTTINARVNRIRRVMKWAIEFGHARAEVLMALQAVRPLRRGRTAARETPGVKPVDHELVMDTCEHMPAAAAAIVQLMWWTGMRPGEACSMRPADLDRSGETWIYAPREHKTEHHGQQRRVALGPRSREIIAPWLDREGDPWLFPGVADERWLFRHGRDGRYTPNTLRQAVVRAANRAGVAPWTPLQLRHAAATRLRKLVGLEATRTVLGHSKASTTEIYAEIDTEKAIDAMALLG